ncbi:MAG: hypothetical protein Q4G30_04965 [Actinomycetaceae bacterium]|nr:hypothetical protein [Actinomycetaceae bacterium]
MSVIGIALSLGAELEDEFLRTVEDSSVGFKVIRRCASDAELLATIAAERVSVAVFDADMIDIDSELIRTIGRSGVKVVAICDPVQSQRLRSLGIDSVISRQSVEDLLQDGPVESDVTRLLGAIRSVVSPVDRPVQPQEPPDSPESLPKFSLPPPPDEEDERLGKIITVWGTQGAPGRSFIALNLAAQLAISGEVLVVDADTVSPVFTQLLGLGMQSSGVAAACRIAGHGRLTQASLRALCLPVGGGVSLLSGLSKANRWREVTHSALQRLLEEAATTFPWVIVDVSSEIDTAQDTELSFGPTRFQATRAAIEAADLTLIVGAADPIGIRRLMSVLDTAQDEGLAQDSRMIIVNKVRQSVTGARGDVGLADALRKFAGIHSIETLPFHSAHADHALIEGCDIASVEPQSELTQACARLARDLAKTFDRVIVAKRTRKRARGS